MADGCARPAGAVEALPVGPLGTNCYLVDDGAGGVAVVDPGAEPQTILAALAGRPVSAVLVTHGHFDHVGAVDELGRACPAGWCISAVDAARLQEALAFGAASFGIATRVDTAPARLLADGDVVEAGMLRLRVVACPGHSVGSVCYIDDAHGLLFCGDTLFAGSAGRTDLPGADAQALYASLASLAALPPATRAFPGHGPATTVGREVEGNAFVRRAIRLHA